MKPQEQHTATHAERLAELDLALERYAEKRGAKLAWNVRSRTIEEHAARKTRLILYVNFVVLDGQETGVADLVHVMVDGAFEDAVSELRDKAIACIATRITR